MSWKGRSLCSLVAAAALLAACTPAAAATDEPAFCAETVLHDHLQPLERLPQLRKPPANGKLPFGPDRLRVSTLDPLLVGGGWIGFSLMLDLDSGTAPVRPGWRLSATLTRVDWQGREVTVVKRWRSTASVVDSRKDLRFDELVDKQPGVYRLSVGIRNKAGKRLGGFGYYARVVSPTANAYLAVPSGPYRPGESIWARVENFGTARVEYGVQWELQRFNGSAFERAPESPEGPWILPLYSTEPGYSSDGCVIGLTVEPTMSGRYRLLKPIRYSSGLYGPALSFRTDLIAEFDVVP